MSELCFFRFLVELHDFIYLFFLWLNYVLFLVGDF